MANCAAASVAFQQFDVPHAYEVNRCVHSCQLIRNDTPFQYREGVVEDLDYSLQVIMSRVWVTVVFFEFRYVSMPHMAQADGCTDYLYQTDTYLGYVKNTIRR